MASEGAGKVRAKRYNDHGKPYERRRSIIGIVTDTVKGIFKSTWSTQDDQNKVSPGTSQEGNGRSTHNNIQHKSGPNNTHGLDNNLGQSYIQQPGMSATAPGPSKLHAQIPVGMSQIPPQQMNRPEPVNFTSDQLPFMQYQGKPASLIVNGGDDRSELSECSVSTSGCSSMAPHHDKKEFQHDILRHPESRIHQMRQELGGSITPSKELESKIPQNTVTDIRKLPEKSFMWSGHSPARRSSLSVKPNTPSFNISIFGSSQSADRSVQNRSGHNESIFYSGKTTYGGFSSQKKRKLQEVSPQQVTPNKRQVKAKPVTSNVSGISSSSARRILSTLERMSSPLSDAKKIPSYNSSLVDSPLSFTPSSFSSLARRKSMPYKSNTSGLLKGPPVHSLNTPGTIQIAKNFNNSQYLTPVSQESTPKEETSSSCAVTGTQTPQSYSEPSSSSTSRSGKMKHSRSQHYSNKKEENEDVEIPDLPTEFTLPVSSMPKFDFKSPSVTSTPLPDVGQAAKKSHTAASVQQSGNGPFTFSTPIPKSQPEKPPQSMSVQNFQFSSPINIDIASSSTGKVSAKGLDTMSKKNICAQEKTHVKPDLEFKFDPSTAKRKSVSPEDGPQTSKSTVSPNCQQSASSLQATPELKSGSVMDILGGSQKSSKTAETSTVKQTETKTQLPTAPISSGPRLSEMFKKPAGSWDCPTCMMQNKADAATCPACATSKPGSAPEQNKAPTEKVAALPKPSIPVENSLASLFKKEEGTWECDTCMVMNKATATKCIACETSKPGVKKATSFTSAGGFKVGPSGGFQFGAPISNVSVELGSSGGIKFVQNSTDDDKTSSTKQEIGGFKFGASLDSDSQKNSAGDGKVLDNGEKSDLPSTGGFKFGSSLAMPSTDSNPPISVPSGGFKFGASLTAKSDDSSKDTNSAEGVDSVKTQDGGKVDAANGGTPSVAGFSYGASVAAGKKDSAPPSLDKKVPSAGFKFGGQVDKLETTKAEVKPVQNPGLFAFGAPVSSNATSQASEKASNIQSIVPGSIAETKPVGSISFTSNNLENKPAFSADGAQKKNESAPSATGLFAFRQQTNKEPSTVAFAFGSQPKSESVSNEIKPAVPSFGSTNQNQTSSSSTAATSTVNTGIFTFGSSAKTTESQPASSAVPFAFGASKTQTASTTSSAQSSSLFMFGSSGNKAAESTSTVAAPAFNFSAGTKPATAATPQTQPSATGMFFTGKPSEAVAPSTTAASNMFSFSGKPGNTTTSTTNSTFSFGQSNQTSVTSTVPTFGNQSTSSSSSFGGFTKSASSPAFGSVAKTSEANMFGTATNTATAPFGGNNVPTFGTSNSTAPTPFGSSSTPSAPAFGATTASTAFGTTTAPATAFGGQNNGTTTPFGAQNTSGGFQFGAQQPSHPAASVFQFGGQQPSQPTNSMFQANQSTAPASTGFNFSQAAAQPTAAPGGNMNFNFNAGGVSSPPQPSGSFQFNASAAPGTPAGASNPFSVQGAPAASTTRRVKKATRKLRK